MHTTRSSFASKVTSFFHSRKCFWIILAVFALESAWIAAASLELSDGF